MNTLTSWLSSWTMDGKLSILFFPLLAGLLLYASLKLVNYAEVIIAKSRFGGGFVGGTLIAGITSAPELITEIVQAVAKKPENGMGDDIGSNAFSAFLIGVAAIVSYKYLFMNKLGTWTKVSVMLSFVISAFLSIFLAINKDVSFMKHIGFIPMAFFFFYVFSIWLTYKFGDEDEPETAPKFTKHVTLKEAGWWFAFWSLAVIFFSVLVNIDVITFQDGIGIPSESAGGVFLAVTTSLPEVVAFFAFLKKKQPAAAVASLIGSHFFNIAISFFGDMAYTSGPTFNKSEMKEHYPLAILTAAMLLVICVHFVLAHKFKALFEKRIVYLTIPSIVVVGYIVGWVCILTLHH